MTIGRIGLLAVMTLVTIALIVGCQPSRDAELERLASAVDVSNENYSVLAGSVDGINKRLDVIEGRIDDLGSQVEGIDEQIDTNDERMRTHIATEIHRQVGAIESRIDDLASQVEGIDEQIDTNDERMRTHIATEIHRQVGAIESRIDDLASQVGDFESSISIQETGLPKWKQGTSVEEGQSMLNSCVAGRFGVLGELMGDEIFSDENIREFTQDMPAGMSEANSVRMVGILFGCWE